MISDQDGLLAEVVSVLRSDSRVGGVWLTGSYGRGEQDQYSDLDLWVLAEEQDVEPLANDWPRLSSQVSRYVLQQQVGALPIFNQVLPNWLRYDVSFGDKSELVWRPQSTHRPVYDPSGHSSSMPADGEPLLPKADAVERLCTEFVRVLGLLPVVLGRDELVLGASGASLLRTLVLQLVNEQISVVDRGGALSLRRKIDADLYQELAELPAIAADRQSVVGSHVALCDLFVRLAADVCEKAAVRFPVEFFEATSQNLRNQIGIELPSFPPPQS